MQCSHVERYTTFLSFQRSNDGNLIWKAAVTQGSRTQRRKQIRRSSRRHHQQSSPGTPCNRATHNASPLSRVPRGIPRRLLAIGPRLRSQLRHAAVRHQPARRCKSNNCAGSAQNSGGRRKFHQLIPSRGHNRAARSLWPLTPALRRQGFFAARLRSSRAAMDSETATR